MASTLSSLNTVKRGTGAPRPDVSALYTDVLKIGDRSGSMASTRGGSQEGAVAYMEEHKTTAENLKPSMGAHLEFVSFDTTSLILYSGEASELTNDDLLLISREMEPRGATRLFDTVVETLTRQMARIDDKIAAQPELVRETIAANPGLIKTSCAIMTDGLDNRSEHTMEDCKKLIDIYKEKYGGIAMFIGANIDAEATAKNFGIHAGMSLQMGSDRLSSIGAARAVAAAQSRSISAPHNVSGGLGGGDPPMPCFTEGERSSSQVYSPAPPLSLLTPPVYSRSLSMGGGLGGGSDDGSGRD